MLAEPLDALRSVSTAGFTGIDNVLFLFRHGSCMQETDLPMVPLPGPLPFVGLSAGPPRRWIRHCSPNCTAMDPRSWRMQTLTAVA